MDVQSKTDANFPRPLATPCAHYEKMDHAGFLTSGDAGAKVVRMRDDGA